MSLENGCGWGWRLRVWRRCCGLVRWDDENEFGEWVWMGLEVESMERVLWIMTRDLAEAIFAGVELGSLMQLWLKICSFCEEI